MKNLRNANNLTTQKPIIYDVEKDKMCIAVAGIVNQLLKDKKSIAIITRQNHQITEISKELNSRGIEHSTTYSSSSKDAKTTIITFLKGLFSNEPNIIRNSLFTPFSPITLQEAFAIDDRAKLNALLKNPKIKLLRDSARNLEDINRIFDKIILPTAVNYGKEYFLSALNVRNACKEAEEYLHEKSYKNFIPKGLLLGKNMIMVYWL